jgi:uncharacterized membrane protein YdbT with pleckstrin-like domain
MTDAPDFLWGYLPFWISMYVLSAVAWTCLARFLLGFFVSHDSRNYIWRGFRILTDWIVLTTRFVLRAFVAIMLLQVGMVPMLRSAG